MEKKRMMIPKNLQNEKLRFCRVKKGTKKPFEKDWTNKLYTYLEILKYLPNENYGVLCGHGDLAVIDSDNVHFQLAVENMLPETYRVETGSGGTHNYFFVPGLKQKIILELDDEQRTHLGEIQSFGTQVVAPGSIHPNGKPYKEKNQVPIRTISYGELMIAIKPFMKKIIERIEENAEYENKEVAAIDDLSVADIWGTAGLKANGSEYFGPHPIHGSTGGMNFRIDTKFTYNRIEHPPISVGI